MYRNYLTNSGIKKPSTSKWRDRQKTSRQKLSLFDKYYVKLHKSSNDCFLEDVTEDGDNDKMLINDDNDNDNVLEEKHNIHENEDKILENYSISNNNQDEGNNIIENELMRNINNDSRSIFREKLSENELCAALLSIFYATNISQTGFKTILKFAGLLVEPLKTPTSFDECSKALLRHCEDSIDSDKKWYCPVCKIMVTIKNCYQRSCHICRNKLHAYYTFGLKKQLNRIFEKNILFLKKHINFYETDYINDIYLSIWPIILIINELPIEIRFCIENIIIAGN